MANVGEQVWLPFLLLALPFMAAFLVLIAIYGCKARAKSNPIPGRNTRKRIPVSNCPEKVLAARQRWFLICDSSAKSNTRNLNMRNPMRGYLVQTLFGSCYLTLWSWISDRDCSLGYLTQSPWMSIHRRRRSCPTSTCECTRSGWQARVAEAKQYEQEEQEEQDRGISMRLSRSLLTLTSSQINRQVFYNPISFSSAAIT